MKKIILKYKILFACISLQSGMLITAMLTLHNVYSQNIKIEGPKTCGGYIIDAAALRIAKDFESANANRLLSASFSVRVYFHICRNDDGTNAGATEAQIQSEFNQLVADYSINNICFVNMGLAYINNSPLNNMNPINSSLLQPYLVPNCVNIFYHASIAGVGGYSYNIPSTVCSIARGNIGAGHTISHEVGHCFGLLHTFENFESTSYEKIDGSNSSTAADQIADTPADPWAYNDSVHTCFKASTCCYTGNCTDPNGQTNFSPPYSNMMAYWWSLGYTNLTITSGQFARINSYLSTNSNLQNCESSASLTIGPVTYISGYHMLSAINSLTTSGSVNLNGSTITTLGGGLVLLEPGFDANASSGALILIRPSACGTGAHRDALQTNPEIVSKIISNTKDNSNNLKCYPNPFSQKFTLEFGLTKAEEASIKLYDLGGKQLKTISNSFFTEGRHQVSVDASGLPAGIYIIIIQTPKFRKEQKIIKTN